ncbi:hypothetical protein F5146DRAFT_1070065 [Armillaria mellea]|nr:hypothetical protein F5146DRAFT_1070065 [Armillaria mellea]
MRSPRVALYDDSSPAMLSIPLSFILFSSYAASWQFQLNSTAVVNTSASVTWTRDADDSTTVGFGFRLRQPDVLPSRETTPYWCQFGGVTETAGNFSVQFDTAGSYIAEAMQLTAAPSVRFEQLTNSSSDILGSSGVISVQAADSQLPSAQDVAILNFFAAKAVPVTSTTTSAPPTTSSLHSTTRSIISIPADTSTPSSSPSVSASNNTAIIAGSVCGSLGVVAIITGVGFGYIEEINTGYDTSHDASPGTGTLLHCPLRIHILITTASTPAAAIRSTPTASDLPRKGLTALATLQTEGQLIEENERQRRLISRLERQMRHLREQQGSALRQLYVSGSSSGLY